MCDILAISAGYNYTPKNYLPIFAEKGGENMNGWGIGFFREDQALVGKIRGERCSAINKFTKAFRDSPGSSTAGSSLCM